MTDMTNIANSNPTNFRLWTHKLCFQANAVMTQSLVMEALNERRTFLAERRAVFTACAASFAGHTGESAGG